jgi:hypothetical protein
MASERIKPVGLQTAVLARAREAKTASQKRNGRVHARWVLKAVTIETSVKKGKLEHIFTGRSANEIMDLARRMWELYQEGIHLCIDLAVAGFTGITVVSDCGATTTPPTTNFPVDGSTMLPRPEPPARWPGDSLFESL